MGDGPLTRHRARPRLYPLSSLREARAGRAALYLRWRVLLTTFTPAPLNLPSANVPERLGIGASIFLDDSPARFYLAMVIIGKTLVHS